ncbi:MAG: hypothetical protein GTO22_06725 [Gemmatimonadales bacterium]|nr:hypothetical protein [Gemmatimonadales bacterium]
MDEIEFMEKAGLLKVRHLGNLRLFDMAEYVEAVRVRKWKEHVRERDRRKRQRGKIKCEKCERCGATKGLTLHHTRYEPPRITRCLCRRCHLDIENGGQG